MAPDKLSRDPGDGEEPTSDAVRIIAAEELEEVAERREVVRRRSPDEPGYKDRPPAPPSDVRPAIRFPLPDSADASSVERPRPAPVEARRAEGSAPRRSGAEPTPVFLGEAPEDSDPGGGAALGPDEPDDARVGDDPGRAGPPGRSDDVGTVGTGRSGAAPERGALAPPEDDPLEPPGWLAAAADPVEDDDPVADATPAPVERAADTAPVDEAPEASLAPPAPVGDPAAPPAEDHVPAPFDLAADAGPDPDDDLPSDDALPSDVPADGPAERPGVAAAEPDVDVVDLRAGVEGDDGGSSAPAAPAAPAAPFDLAEHDVTLVAPVGAAPDAPERVDEPEIPATAPPTAAATDDDAVGPVGHDDAGPLAAAPPPPAADAPPPPDRPAPPDQADAAPTTPPEAPVLDLGPASGEHRLPHWTEPPTGEVPRVVIGQVSDADPDEDERWASYTAGTRWRDEHDASDHGDLMADLAASPDEPVAERLGALDTSDRLSDDAFLNFDDVDLDPKAQRRRGGRRSRPRPPAPEPPPPPDHDPLAAIISVDPPVPEDRPAPPPPAREGRPSRRERPDARRVGRAAGLGERPAPPPPDQDPAAPRSRRRPPAEVPPRTGGRNVPQAAIVGVALGVVALLALNAGPAIAMILVEIVVVVAGAEYYGAVQRGGFRPATLLGLAAVAALPLAAYWRGEAAFPLVLFLVFTVGVLWYLLGVGGPVRPTANLGVTLVGVVWIGFLGGFAALILDIPVQGPSILLVAIVAAVAHDAGGFFIGRAMGRTPFTAISPGKTLEGLVGGVLTALVAVFIVAVALGVGPFSAGEALVFGLVTALVAPLGDLAESLFKRDLGLKDMGSIIPEHGGVLDRFDAVLFVLPTAYYAARALGLAG